MPKRSINLAAIVLFVSLIVIYNYYWYMMDSIVSSSLSIEMNSYISKPTPTMLKDDETIDIKG
jgi:hypothetical protein